MMQSKEIAILIPCYNESISIKQVIQDFKHELPNAKIYVYDNNSSDDTANIARACGAIVRYEKLQGKGSVVRSMFRDIEADIYVMVDGDNTYPASFVHKLIQPINEGGVDMVIGDRHTSGDYKKENKRALHHFGNHLVKSLINYLFDAKLEDIMSGYRAFSKRFVKSMPINSAGFEIETEMSIHSLDKRLHVEEIAISYKDREEGSFSKLNTISDGVKVLKTIFWLFKDYKPLAFFTTFSFFFFLLSLLAGLPVIIEFVQTAYITKIPSAILAVGLMLISIISLFVGFILDTIVKQHKENFELHILSSTR